MRRFALLLGMLILAAAPGRANDDPEPPGGGDARKLLGKWTASRMLYDLKPSKTPVATYTFERDRFSQSSAAGTYRGKLKIDAKTKPIMLELKYDDPKVTSRVAVKIEKGELFIALRPGDDPKRVDFTGADGPVLVLTPQKK